MNNSEPENIISLPNGWIDEILAAQNFQEGGISYTGILLGCIGLIYALTHLIYALAHLIKASK